MFVWENTTNITIANLFSEINNKYYKVNKHKTKNHRKKFCIRNMYYNISFILSKKRPSHHKILF